MATTANNRVPLARLIAYGSGGLIPIALFNSVGQLMALLGNISLGLSALWIGIIMIVPRLWDALSDPVIGYLTDNTSTPWGRRRPFLLVGGIAVALAYVALWWVPKGDWIRGLFGGEMAYNWFQLVYILGGLLLFFTACNLFEVPHGALGMEMSSDYHERTRLFSAKSFLGNLFAMGTPWLFKFSDLPSIKGPGGNQMDGMRYISILVACVLIPLSIWWFWSLWEPRETQTRERRKTRFTDEMRVALSNLNFMRLVATVFTLAMGFNFVSLFSYYITIFYLYGGNTDAAGDLLGITGMVWAITGLVAVFPLNWLGKKLSKSTILMLSIVIMCLAQISKVFCYNPELPYLVLIPTILLSAGMLMFFTLGSSMIADICDEDELHSGTRSEGTYYSVYWWFIKMGSAFASLVTGLLLTYTLFDERQNVLADSVTNEISSLEALVENWQEQGIPEVTHSDELVDRISSLQAAVEKSQEHFSKRAEAAPNDHATQLSERAARLSEQVKQLPRDEREIATIIDEANKLKPMARELKDQSPETLLRLRVVEIGLPLLLSLAALGFIWNYPLTEQRCREIQELLAHRREEPPSS